MIDDWESRQDQLMIDDWWVRSEWWLMMMDDWLTIETDKIKERNNQEGRKQHLSKNEDEEWKIETETAWWTWIHFEWDTWDKQELLFWDLGDVWLWFVRYVWHVDLVVGWLLLLIRLMWWLVCRWALYQFRVRFVVGLWVGPVVVRPRVMIRLFVWDLVFTLLPGEQSLVVGRGVLQ